MKRFLSNKTVIRLGFLLLVLFSWSVLKIKKPPEEGLYKVVRVIDGDTIEIEGGERVRYIGIDAPETSSDECFSKEATKKNKELVEGKLVRLEKDISETDKYRRLLRYVYADDLFINEFLVREGYAAVSTVPPDVKYQDQFLEAEREARENSRGLWGECNSL